MMSSILIRILIGLVLIGLIPLVALVLAACKLGCETGRGCFETILDLWRKDS